MTDLARTLEQHAEYCAGAAPGTAELLMQAARHIRELESLNAERNRQNAAAFTERDALRVQINRAMDLRETILHQSWPAAWITETEFELRARLSEIYGLVAPGPEDQRK